MGIDFLWSFSQAVSWRGNIDAWCFKIPPSTTKGHTKTLVAFGCVDPQNKDQSNPKLGAYRWPATTSLLEPLMKKSLT